MKVEPGSETESSASTGRQPSNRKSNGDSTGVDPKTPSTRWEAASLSELSDAFSKLDNLRDILIKTLQGWQPPQLVVLGSESSGKSTLLSRLIMVNPPLLAARYACVTARLFNACC